MVGVLSEGVDVEGRDLTVGLFETMLMVLGSGGGVEVNVASTVVASITDWMDEESADMMDSDLGGMVDRITGIEVIFGVPTGVKVAGMVMGIDEVARVEVEMMVSEVGTTVVVFVMIAVILLL